MKSLTLIGLILLGLASVLFYFIPDFSVVKLFEPTTLMGILAGVGIGLFTGGIVGYVSKGSAIKEAQRRKEYLQLQKDKKELEKQAAELAKIQHKSSENPYTNENPQI
ncbi:hypothetical protein AAH994_04110 [Weeksellaceae bacterium A-14]|uniref:hypothetical protein n=1 Tax=Daejeonia sp. YH14 TaxID=3439042 RepID=UPI0031E4CD0E